MVSPSSHDPEAAQVTAAREQHAGPRAFDCSDSVPVPSHAGASVRGLSVVNGHTSMIAWQAGGNLADSCAFVKNVLRSSTPADRRVGSGRGAV